MITMQELAEKFKKQAGIAEIPPVSPRLTHSCEKWRGLCNLLQIEQNFIFFSSKKGIIDIWRSNLLWQLSKQCLPISVLQDREQAERDFVNLLALESQIPAYRLKSLLFKKGEKDFLAKIIPFLESFYITWTPNTPIESDRKSRIFFLNTTLEQLPPASFLKQAKEKGQVVLCFVERSGLFARHAARCSRAPARSERRCFFRRTLSRSLSLLSAAPECCPAENAPALSV